MKVFAHIGMPKTGTSSIQDTFAALGQSDPLYFVPKPANHGGIASLLFEEEAAQNRRFVSYGRKLEHVKDDRIKWAETLRAAISTSQASVGLFSAERLASIDDASVERMYKFFTQAGADLQIIGYVRPAASYMASSFQQNVKGGENTFDLERAWPSYTSRFEKYDRIVGRDSVILRPFVREEMHGGDVVLDFANIVGADIQPDQIIRSNDSLSLEAVALLYVHRKFGTGFQRADIVNRLGNRVLIESLKAIGTARFGFSRSLVGSLIDQNREDLNWIESRVNMKMDGITASEDGIGSEKMLIETATRAAPLLDQLEAGLFNGDDPVAIAAALDKYIRAKGKIEAGELGRHVRSRDVHSGAVVQIIADNLRTDPVLGDPNNTAKLAPEKTMQISKRALRNLNRAGFMITPRD